MSEQEKPAWVEMRPGLWWWGDWEIEHYEGYGYKLTVGSGMQYGPFPTLDAAKEKAEGVQG